ALVGEGARAAFARYVRGLLGPTGHRLGFALAPGDSEEQKLLREAVLGALGTLGDDAWALAEARRLALAWLADPQSVSADLARVPRPLAAKHGATALWERFAGVLRDRPRTPEVRLLALAGLTGFDDPAMVKRTLGLTLAGVIKTQDIRYVLPGIGM